MVLRIDCYLVSLAKSLIVDIDEADIKDREDREATNYDLFGQRKRFDISCPP